MHGFFEESAQTLTGTQCESFTRSLRNSKPNVQRQLKVPGLKLAHKFDPPQKPFM
jgi:hypothetical protein